MSPRGQWLCTKLLMSKAIDPPRVRPWNISRQSTLDAPLPQQQRL